MLRDTVRFECKLQNISKTLTRALKTITDIIYNNLPISSENDIASKPFTDNGFHYLEFGENHKF